MSRRPPRGKQSAESIDVTAALAANREAALALVPVSRETLGRLDRFVATLLAWQKRINLIAPASVGEIWTRHVADSLQLLPLAPAARVWLDLGSGGGFPGLMIACALADTPAARVHLVESTGKKAAFLREAVRVTGAPAIVHQARIEHMGTTLDESIEVVTARALAPLTDLLDLAEPWLKRGAQALFPKGQDVGAELTEASKYWNIEAIMSPSGTDPSGQIVTVQRAERRPTGALDVVSEVDAGAMIGSPARRRVLALANQKGGVGKTTTAINLGTALAAIGEQVLIIDLDPQGNASTGLGIDRKSRRFSTYDVLIGQAGLREAIHETAVPRLHIVPSTMDLSGFELEFAQERDRAYRLRNALASLDPAPAAGVTYSYVLVDCPPSLNLVTVNAMAAADAILVPLQCEFFALEGLSQLLKTVEQVRATLNPDLTIHGVVLTMYDARNNLAGQVVADVRQFMGEKVYETVIPRNVRVSEAPSYGKPVLLYDLKCLGSQAYLRLASEIIQREKSLRAA